MTISDPSLIVSERELRDGRLVNDETGLGVGRVQEAALAVVLRMPDRVNPTKIGGCGCVYTKHDDPDHHCLGGQILLELGYELPSVESSFNSCCVTALPNLTGEFSHDGWMLLIACQLFADRIVRDIDVRMRRPFVEAYREACRELDLATGLPDA